ncbi:MAG: aspartyl aminopeptidase, partial [Ilumatobacteraceae bacterium]
MDVDDLISFLAASPSPWHVVATAAQRLRASGFEPVDLSRTWAEVPARGYVTRGAAL